MELVVVVRMEVEVVVEWGFDNDETFLKIGDLMRFKNVYQKAEINLSIVSGLIFPVC